MAEKTVILTINLNGATGRDVLAGFLKYRPKQSRFALKLAFSSEDVLSMIAKANSNVGIINAHSPDLVCDHLAQYPKIPVVTCIRPFSMSTVKRRRTSFVVDDNQGIARLAYDHFRWLGQFRSYVVVPSQQPTWWSMERQREFIRLLKKNNRQKTIVYAGPSDGSDLTALGEFLARLPKPAAVFCTYDIRARDVIEAAHQQHLHIPNDLSVLGVDDDGFICEQTRPKLSSIRADHIKLGFLMAQELDRYFQTKGAVRPRTIKCPPLDVIVRESSGRIAPATTYLIQKAKQFIEQNASVRLRVSDVAAHLGISQRLLEMRFAQHHQRSVAAEIRQTWIKVAKKLLREEKGLVQDLARRLGFSSINSFNVIFRRETGISPRQYRQNSA